MAGGTVTISGGNVIHTFTSSGYLTPLKLVNNSLRFRSSASAYLNRTPSTASNRKTWTWSAWVKRGTLSVANRLFAADDGSASTDQDYNTLLFNSSNQLQFSGNLTDFRITTAVYRDPAAWYHIVFAVDTTQATAANRFKLYVNGVEVTAFGTSNNPAQNTDLAVNAAIGHYIGAIATSPSGYLDGYQTEINFIDGQQLTPNSFGTANSYGVWQPITYGGSYGTNGFYLPFSVSSSSMSASYLQVAGGGAGGGAGGYVGGGGGAGGYLSGTTTINSNTSYAVTVGAGGAGSTTALGASGSNSQFGTLTASVGGGGGGATSGTSGANGGSGGGAGYSGGTFGTGTSGQGNNGANGNGGLYGTGGGGGGAGSAGVDGNATNGGNGGTGSASSISGSSLTYAGGGGGAAGAGGTRGSGGSSIGGDGADTTAATSGSANRGGGGGAANATNTTSGSGGSGVVVISYSGSAKFAGGNISSSGGNTIHTFTSSGVLTGLFSDYSPQGNNWTGNNFNVTTSGPTYDSMTDVPTLTSATASNYCTLNPLNNGGTTSQGNLALTSSTTAWVSSSATILPYTGKYYFEGSMGTISSGSYIAIGLRLAGSNAAGEYAGNQTNSFSILGNSADLYTYTNNTSTNTTSYTATTSTAYQVAVDFDAGKIWLGYNNTWLGGGSPSAGTSPTYTFTANTPLAPILSAYNQTTFITFGQRPFAYTAPTNFVAINTFNL